MFLNKKLEFLSKEHHNCIKAPNYEKYNWKCNSQTREMIRSQQILYIHLHEHYCPNCRPQIEWKLKRIIYNVGIHATIHQWKMKKISIYLAVQSSQPLIPKFWAGKVDNNSLELSWLIISIHTFIGKKSLSGPTQKIRSNAKAFFLI